MVSLRLTLWLGIVLIIVTPAQAQYYEPDRASVGMTSTASYFYVKPVFGTVQSRVMLEGNSRFTKPLARFDLFNWTTGIAVGYHVKSVEIESGISHFQVYTGYYFSSNTITGAYQALVGE